ncbi:MAG: carbohydrate kinase [Clostridia bacterium]|nr:carbohydrate kinase [Clostridia bacterium]
MIIGGLDVGTTGCKLTAFDHKGNFIYNSYKAYEITRKNGEHELDAQVIFAAVCDVIRDTAQNCALSVLGVTTFGETFVALDQDDNVLLPSMLYTDPRGEKECADLCAILGEQKLTYISGVKPHQMYSLPKLMWIKNNLPEVYRKIDKILLMEDFIVYMLCGRACIDYSLAARTMAFDIREKCWSNEILDAAGIDKKLLSEAVPAFNVAGDLKKDVAEKLGIKGTVKIVNGAHDQVASAVGAGVFEKGQAADGTGTVECVTPVFNAIPENKSLYDEGYSVVPYVFDGTYVCYALSFTGGATLKWFRDNFAKDKSYKELDDTVKNGPSGIMILPHFAGAANPYMDNGSKAAMIGLTLEHTASDVYKALMEGVTYEILTNIEHLADANIGIHKLFATGGGATSEKWLQIKADILNRPITSLSAKEVGACGTCMMAGVAVGAYKDLYEAKQIFVKESKTFVPNPENVKKYQKISGAYKEIYDAIRPIEKKGYGV